MNKNILEKWFYLSVIAYVILMGLTVPLNSDEIWFASRNNNFIATGSWFGFVFEKISFADKFYSKILSLFYSDYIYNYVIFRLPGMFFTLAATFFIYLFGKVYFKSNLAASLISLVYLFFATVSPSAGLVFRPEHAYSNIATILFSGFYISFVSEENKSKAFGIVGILLTPFAFTQHPVGLGLYGLTVIFIYLQKKTWIQKVKYFLAYSIYYGVVFYCVAILPHNLLTIIEGLNEYAVARSDHSLSKFYLTYFKLLLQKEQLFLLLPSILGLFLYCNKNIEKRELEKLNWRKFTSISILSYLVFLLCLPGKNPAYFSVLYFFFSFGIVHLVSKFSLSKDVLKCAIVSMLIFMLTFLWIDFFKNEEFLRLCNFSNYRVNKINQLEKIIKDKRVLAPIVWYSVVHKNAKTFFPNERYFSVQNTPNEPSEQMDYIIWPANFSDANSLKDLFKFKELVFVRAYQWQKMAYLLYKVKY